MPQALFLDLSTAEPPAPGDHAEMTRRPALAVLRVNPQVLDTDRVGVEALLRSLSRLKESDLTPLQEAVAKITENDDRAAWTAIDDQLEADNKALRDRFVTGGRAFTLWDLAEYLSLGTDEAHALATQWEVRGEILSVEHRGVAYFPTFQFQNGRPHPTVGLILAALPPSVTPWQRVFWFVSANGWVDNNAPSDHLDRPDLVIQAARYEGEPVVG